MDHPKIAPLYVYDAVSRGWYVNLFDYPNKTHAQEWVRRCQVTPDTWLQAVERMRGEP
jgi:hypothetical protein